MPDSLDSSLNNEVPRVPAEQVPRLEYSLERQLRGRVAEAVNRAVRSALNIGREQAGKAAALAQLAILLHGGGGDEVLQAISVMVNNPNIRRPDQVASQEIKDVNNIIPLPPTSQPPAIERATPTQIPQDLMRGSEDMQRYINTQVANLQNGGSV